MDELDFTDAEKKATYSEIKEYVLEYTGLKVSSLYIAQVKQKCVSLSGRITINRNPRAQKVRRTSVLRRPGNIFENRNRI